MKTEMHGTQTEQLHAEKAEDSVKRCRSSLLIKGQRLTSGTRGEPDISGSSKAFSQPDTKGTGVTGRSRAAGRRRAGWSVPTGKEQTFFPSHSARRASFHYGKNDIDHGIRGRSQGLSALFHDGCRNFGIGLLHRDSVAAAAAACKSLLAAARLTPSGSAGPSPAVSVRLGPARGPPALLVTE